MSKREPGMAYNTKKLNKFFAIIAVIFMIVTVWMMLDDYIRPWKAVQTKGMEIEQEFLERKIAETNKSLDPAKLKELESEIEKAKEVVDSNTAKLNELEKKQSLIKKKIYIQNMQNGTHGSLSGEYQFEYETAHMKGKDKKASRFQKLMAEQKKLFNEGRDNLKAFQAEDLQVSNEIKELKKYLTDSEKALSKFIGSRDRLLVAKSQVEKNFVWYLRNSPFIDYLDPTVKIRQVVMDNLTDDRYFVHTKKVDRCTTCHLHIDKKADFFKELENPYKSHPRLETLAVGIKSAHPIKKFGCTSCHGGEGHRVNDFNSAAHMPNNKEQEHEWVKKHHWHEPHKVPITMYPSKHSEASCTKCHQGLERIPMADTLNEGKELVQSYGCYGCHKVKGWEHLKKPGPSLHKITAKTNKKFIKNWIWAPHTFNPNSRMPAYFGQSNNSKPEFMRKNIAEVNAMAEYIVEKAKNYKPKYVHQKGDAEKGKELIQTIGCIACHQVEGIDEPYNKVKSKRGPYLTGTGSKVDPNWLVSWLMDPSSHQKDTVMPSFRLKEKEANDISTYLLTLRNKKFEGLEFEPMNLEVRDELLAGYFSQFDPIAFAKKKIAKMSDKERTIELGKRTIGKYGCYSCHNIPGFSNDRPPIGPELTNVGSKQVHQFGFGQQKQVDHNRHAWFRAHLENPRRWDIGVPKSFGDLNRMPNFYLEKSEIEKMTTFLLGQVSDYIPLAGQHVLSEKEAVAEKGRKVANKFNCYGCHKIDGRGGSISAAYEDDLNAGPPWLVKEGHRVYPDWLYKFFNKVEPIRPYLQVRMPSFKFTEEERNLLVNHFVRDADQSTFYETPKVTWEPGEREAAVKIFNELACISCHSIGFNNEEAQGPSLWKAHKRLRKSWIKKWITNPTAIQEYTPMPNFWEGGTESAVEGVLDDDPKRQIEAITKYVLELGIKGKK